MSSQFCFLGQNAGAERVAATSENGVKFRRGDYALATIKIGQMKPAALSIRLLALLKKMPVHAGQEDVHRLRTTVRRLEVQLGKCPAKVSNSLKGLRKEAGKVRDIDVHLALLKPALFPKASSPHDPGSGLPQEPESPREKPPEKLREILKSQRDRHIGSLRIAVAEAAPLLQAMLPILAERASRRTTEAQDVHQQVERVRNRFLRWTRRVPEDAERLHRLRIRTKKLRYSLEPLQECKEAAEVAAKLKQVQDAIGSWHDWATLEQLAQRELESPDTPPVCAVLRARTRREYRSARRIAQSVRTWMTGDKPAASAVGGHRLQGLIRKVE